MKQNQTNLIQKLYQGNKFEIKWVQKLYHENFFFKSYLRGKKLKIDTNNVSLKKLKLKKNKNRIKN